MRYFAYFVEDAQGRWARRYEFEPTSHCEWIDAPRLWLCAAAAFQLVSAARQASAWAPHSNYPHPAGPWSCQISVTFRALSVQCCRVAIAFVLLQGVWRREVTPMALQAALISLGTPPTQPPCAQSLRTAVSTFHELISGICAVWRRGGRGRSTSTWLGTLSWLLFRAGALASCAWLTRAIQLARRATKYNLLAPEKLERDALKSHQQSPMITHRARTSS